MQTKQKTKMLQSLFKIRLGYSILKIFGYEHLLDKRKRMIVKLLPENAVIIDCGAHVGGDSIFFARFLPKGIIHSFEPVPGIYQKLVENTKKYKNIKTYNLAISDTEGNVPIFVSSGTSDASSSLLTPKDHLMTNPTVHFEESTTVKATTFDKWSEENKVSVDFMWLDMQGYEMLALKHGLNVMKNCKAVYAEVSLLENYEGQAKYEELKKFMLSHGYKVYKEFMDYEFDGDVLFINTAFFKHL